MGKPKLISFKICPYAQKANILFSEKGVDFDLAFIDPSNPPEWFVGLSPTGNVPLLQVDNNIIFESSVICEYIEDTYQPALHPEDSLQKALNRAWGEFVSSAYGSIYRLLMADTEQEMKKAKGELSEKLLILNDEMKYTPYFNGDKFSIVDVNAAPLLMRLAIIKDRFELDFLKDYPKLMAWSDNILQRETVKTSIVENLGDILSMVMKNRNSFLLTTI